MQSRGSDKARFSEKRDERYQAYRDRLTQDQKKFRILQLLKNEAPVKIGSILDMRIANKMDDLVLILQDMTDKKWIEGPVIPLEQWEKKHECKILDKGKHVVKTLSIIKAISPQHPLFDFDVFNMSNMEETDGILTGKFNAHFTIEPHTDGHMLREIKKLIKNLEEKSR